MLLLISRPAWGAAILVTPTGIQPLYDLHDNDDIRFSPGEYFFPKPIDLPAGLKSVTLSADPGTVTFSAGQRITGWKPATINGKSCWAVYLPAVRLGLWNFRELWVNGSRATRSRYPASGYLAVVIPSDKKSAGKTPWNQGQNWFGFKPADLPDDLPREVEAVVMNRWEESRLPIASIDRDSQRVISSRKSVFQLEDGDPYFLEGAGQWAVHPGDWYLDHKAGMLYYLARAGEKIEMASAIAPTHDRLMNIHGASHLTIRGITFSHSEWNFPEPILGQEPQTGGFGQAAIGVTAAVSLEDCRDCRIESCRFEHLGNYALELGKGCQGDVIDHCTFTDLGSGGMKIGEQQMREASADQTFGNTVTDCRITDGGHMFPSACGIWVGQSYDNNLSHNELADLYYTAISLGWTWGYGPSLCRGNKVEANLIHHIGKKSDGDGPILSDMGAVYTLGARPGTVIAGNYFHDINARIYGGWGIYLDEGSSGLLIENNLVTHTTHGGFHLHYGTDNVLQNNIFALNRDLQIARTRDDPGLNFTFNHNIVYWDTGVFTRTDGVRAEFDNNLYWCFGQGKLQFGQQTWNAWQSAGQDVHSILADPRFGNPARGDFNLRDGSPAEKIGFEPIDASDAGVRK